MIPAWMRDALCRHFPTLLWIAEPGDRTEAAERAMSVVCRACPVSAKCQAYADRRAVTGGYWAGADRTVHPLDVDEDGVA